MSTYLWRRQTAGAGCANEACRLASLVRGRGLLQLDGPRSVSGGHVRRRTGNRRPPPPHRAYRKKNQEFV